MTAPNKKPSWAPRRTHPADVTADRLVQQYEKYFDKLRPYEQTAFGDTIQALREIAGGER